MTQRISFGQIWPHADQLSSGTLDAISLEDIVGPDAQPRGFLAAIIGDGDASLDSGELAYVLAEAGRSGRLAGFETLNGPPDPVSISAHGRIDRARVGSLDPDRALGFSPDRGFGVDNGPDRDNRHLNQGDSITWTLDDGGDGAFSLQRVAFTVNMGGSTQRTQVALDFDGSVLETGRYGASKNGAHVDALLRLGAQGGDTIVLDFENERLSVGGRSEAGPAVEAFFDAFSAGEQNALTIGSLGRGFSVKDLILQRVGEKTEEDSDPDPADPLPIRHPEKIGIGTWQASPEAAELVEQLGVRWYYTWSTWQLSGNPDMEFVPMIWKGTAENFSQDSLDRIAAAPSGNLLAFNEPEIATQSNMSVEEAIAWWPRLMATGQRLGSPAVTATEALGPESWLARFLEAAASRDYDVDFIAVHYYAPTHDIEAFENFLTDLHDAYDLPVWVTEWALIDPASWASNTPGYTPEQNAAFFTEGARMMDELDFVERHAWFASFDGGDGYHLDTHAIENDGTLTAVGQAFVDILEPLVG